MFEEKILNVISNRFSSPDMVSKLGLIAEFAWGFEQWFQIETMFALLDAEIFVSTRGKKAYDADIVVNDGEKDVGIELRCWRLGLGKDNLIDALKDHPEANMYLFLFRNDNDKLSELNKQLINRVYDYKTIGSDWILMLVK